MTKPSDNPADPFKKALAEATKVLANDSDLTVSYSVDAPSGLSGDMMRLPQVSRRMTRDEVLLARGTADALALQAISTTTQPPTRVTSQPETSRAIFTKRWKPRGAKPWAPARCRGRLAISTPRSPKTPAAPAMAKSPTARMPLLRQPRAILMRHLATGRDLPAGAAQCDAPLAAGSSKIRPARHARRISRRASQASRTFARFARSVISDLGYADQLGDDPDAPDEESDDSQEEAEQDEDQPDSTGQDDTQEDEADASPERGSQDESQDAAEAQISMDDLADDELGEEADMPDGQGPA